MNANKQTRYQKIIEKVFFDRYQPGQNEIPFTRQTIVETSAELGIDLPKNIGDVLYSVRYRTSLPESILQTQAAGFSWIIEGKGRAQYAFKLVKLSQILPNENLIKIKIPDATPEIITAHALSDEQALLAKIRYNRLLDIFLGMATYSLQNHLRTTVKGIGQIEIDEIYVGIDKEGQQYVLPVQAKGGQDKLSVVQTKQDLLCCKEKFSQITCRPISTQFITEDIIALFELTLQDEQVKILSEKHYHLVSHDQLSDLA